MNSFHQVVALAGLTTASLLVTPRDLRPPAKCDALGFIDEEAQAPLAQHLPRPLTRDELHLFLGDSPLLD